MASVVEGFGAWVAMGAVVQWSFSSRSMALFIVVNNKVFE